MTRGKLKKIAIILSLLAYAYISPPSSTADWHIEIVDGDNDSDGEYNSLTLDSSNNPHIGYLAISTEGDLNYAYHDGIAWHYVKGDSSSVGIYTSLNLNSDNKPRIIFDTIKYSWCDSLCDNTSNWDIEPVDSNGTENLPSSALDSSGMPHVSYLNESEWFVEYIYRNETGWSIPQDVSNVTPYNRYRSSLVLDSLDKAHISFYDVNYENTVGELRYATNASGDWEVEIIDSSGNAGCFCSIDLDSEDNVHIGYYDVVYSELKYITNASGAWVSVVVDNIGRLQGINNNYISLDLDSSDKVHIGYYDANNGDLKYANNVSGEWVTERVDSAYRGDISLAIDSYNKPHISYYHYEGGDGDLKYAKQCFDMDSDCDDTLDIEDNCPDVYNSAQVDSYPPGGNGIGDACECEGNFDCDHDCDGTDAGVFKVHFGRSPFRDPCDVEPLCKGNFDCDFDVDGTDASMFKKDFGRSLFKNPCPICTQGEWCTY